MREAIGYRGLQAVSIALLAALVTACVVFVPLYERAMLQALTRTELRSAGVAARSLQVTATAGSTDYGTDIEAGSPEQLASLVPASVREAYDAPIAQEQARVDFEPASRRIQGSTGPLVWREDFCAHIELAAGRCPRQRAEIAIGMDDAKVFEVPVGSTVRVPGEADAGSGRGAPLLALRVVGTYRERPSDYWFDTTLTGFAGKQDGPQSPVKHDVWLTPQSTFTAATTPKLSGLRNQVDYPLDVSRTGVDQLDRLGPALNRLSRRLASQPTYGTTMSTSSLPAIDEEVDHQGRQARITIPLLTAQVALLAVVALALVLGAATEQRRPEVAVAMLRGRGRRGARALLLHELLPVVLAGVVIGAGMALVLGAVARATVLPGPVPFELGLGPAVAVLAAVLTVVLVTVLAVRRVSSEPVEQLLRRVPVRRSGWSLGALEAIVVAGAATVVVVFLTGGLSGPVVLAAPVMLAVVVGLLLSHATTPVTAHLGRRILQRGRVGLGVSVLDAARTPATRRSLAIVTVASAVLVFSLSAVAVGGRNREAAAEQQAGAAMRVEVEGQDLPGIRAAVASVDPSGRSLTPVVTVQPPGVGAAATVAVQPTAFSTIALFGNTRPLDPKTLAPPRAAPIQLHGDALRVRIDAENVMVVQPGASKPSVSLLLDLSDPSGNVTQVPIGALPLGVRSGPEAIRATVPCRQGCYLTAITVRTRVGSKVSGIVALSDLTAVSEGDETPVALGPSAAWDTVPGVLTDQMVPDAPGKQRLAIRLATAGGADTVMHQAWLPSRLPVVVAAAAKPGAGRAITVSGIDGIERSGYVTSRLSRVPGAGPDTRLINLDVASRATGIGLDYRVEVWGAHASRTQVHQLTAALQKRGMTTGAVNTLSETRSAYHESVAAWSLALGVVVGLVALLVGLLVVVILAMNTWRSRARDLAALRMSGLRGSSLRTVATLAQLPALVVAVLAGTACGTVGAHFALPEVPLFPSAPQVSTRDLSLPWGVVLAASAVALVILLSAGWLVGASIARRASLDRLRDSV